MITGRPCWFLANLNHVIKNNLRCHINRLLHLSTICSEPWVCLYLIINQIVLNKVSDPMTYLSHSTGFEDVTIFLLFLLLVKLGLGFNNTSFLIKLPLYVAYMTDPSSVDGNQTT